MILQTTKLWGYEGDWDLDEALMYLYLVYTPPSQTQSEVSHQKGSGRKGNQVVQLIIPSSHTKFGKPLCARSHMARALTLWSTSDFHTFTEVRVSF